MTYFGCTLELDLGHYLTLLSRFPNRTVVTNSGGDRHSVRCVLPTDCTSEPRVAGGQARTCGLHG